MQHKYTANLARWPWLALGLLGLLGLARSAHAQNYNAGSLYNTGSLYHSDSFTNASTGSFINTGSSAVAYFAGSTFTNAGTYTAASGATDQFIGPAGAAGTQTLAGTAAPVFYNLTLANGTASAFTVTNPAGANVDNLLTLSNGITTAVNTVAGAIRLTGTGTQASTLPLTGMGTTRYLDGYLSKAGTNAFTYPLGDTNPSTNTGSTTAANAPIYSPITLSSPGGTTLRYTAGTPPTRTSFATQTGGLQLTNVSAREYYPMSVGTVPAASTITIPYGNFGPSAAGTPYVSNPASLTIAAYNGSTWTNLSATTSNTIDVANKTVTVRLSAALSTTYTALALASTSAQNPLPVTLVAFTATKKAADGLLSWHTASELNSAYFELQASPNGTTWQRLTKVAAAGNSAVAHDYSYLDKGLARYGAPVVYYRLRQVDLDGKEYYSPIVTLSPDAAEWNITAYPNPYEIDLTAQLTTSEAGPVTVVMLDATGRTILRREISGVPGSQVIALDDAHTMATGTYTLLVRQNAHTGTLRVVRR